MKNKLSRGYVWKCQSAIRENKRGRAKGGIITGGMGSKGRSERGKWHSAKKGKDRR